jgi:hypothetical protein
MSEASATEPPADPFQVLSKAVYRVLVADLYADIPSPSLTDPERIAERVQAAIGEIASMCPVNAEEARIAERVATADALARECIRRARAHHDEPIPAMQCQAQANQYMRTANAARALLLRVQAARHKREAIEAARAQDDWTMHAAAGLLLAADGHPIAPPPPPPPPEPPAPSAADDDKFARYDEAEQYAVIYPKRAAEIRACGGIPRGATYGPPEAATVRALIASTSPILQEIDRDYGQAPHGVSLKGQ